MYVKIAKLLEVKIFTLKRLSLRNSCANLISFFRFEKSTTNTVSPVSIFHFVVMTEFCTKIKYIIKLVFKTEYILLPLCHCCYIFVYSLTYELVLFFYDSRIFRPSRFNFISCVALYKSLA